MNDSYSVEVLRARHENIQPEVTKMWHSSGRYDTLDEAKEWAATLSSIPGAGVLGIRITKHSWSSEVILEVPIAAANVGEK